MGLYEKEVLDFLDSAPSGYYDSFLDIGAADGYYGVGMLVGGVVKQSTCFEIAKIGREN